MDKTATYLYRLSELPGFKIYKEDPHGHTVGSLIIEADGIKFDTSYKCMEEAVEEAYVHIRIKSEVKLILEQERLNG